MPTLPLTVEQQRLLHQFVAGQPSACGDPSGAFADLLEQVMESVDIRRLESVTPEDVRELLRSTFEVMKVRHLHENGFLSSDQFRARLEIARVRVAAFT